jgi:hypothetical protein
MNTISHAGHIHAPDIFQAGIPYSFGDSTYDNNISLDQVVSAMTSHVLPDDVIQFMVVYFDECTRNIRAHGVDTKEPSDTSNDWPIAHEFDERASIECIEFCNSRGLVGTLRIYLNQVRKIFSGFEGLSAELDYDEGHVVLRLRVRSDQQAALRDYDAWVNWVIDNIKPEYAIYFTMMIERM